MDLQSIGKKIKEKRQQKHISQEKLAELVDVMSIIFEYFTKK